MACRTGYRPRGPRLRRARRAPRRAPYRRSRRSHRDSSRPPPPPGGEARPRARVDGVSPATGTKRKSPPAQAPAGEEKMRQRPTLPHGFPCSTIGSGGLNFRVRDGNGCDPTDIATAKHEKERRRSLLKTEYEG